MVPSFRYFNLIDVSTLSPQWCRLTSFQVAYQLPSELEWWAKGNRSFSASGHIQCSADEEKNLTKSFGHKGLCQEATNSLPVDCIQEPDYCSPGKWHKKKQFCNCLVSKRGPKSILCNRTSTCTGGQNCNKFNCTKTREEWWYILEKNDDIYSKAFYWLCCSSTTVSITPQ